MFGQQMAKNQLYFGLKNRVKSYMNETISQKKSLIYFSLKLEINNWSTGNHTQPIPFKLDKTVVSPQFLFFFS